MGGSGRANVGAEYWQWLQLSGRVNPATTAGEFRAGDTMEFLTGVSISSNSCNPPPPWSAITLLGALVSPTYGGGATLSGTSILVGDNDYFSLPSSALGAFGAGDFSIEITLRATLSGTAAFADGTYGALFIRSSQSGSPYTGPSSFIFADGHIRFRLRGDDSCNTPAGAVNDWTSPHTLLFTRSVNTLSIAVDGGVVQTCTMSLTPDTAQFTSADMVFARNHVNPAAQNLEFAIGPIVLSVPPSPSPPPSPPPPSPPPPSPPRST